MHALLGGLTTRRAGLLLFASMRMTPLLTFGWVNGIAGALTDVPVALFALAFSVPISLIHIRASFQVETIFKFDAKCFANVWI